MEGIKYDGGKLPWDLLPFEAVAPIVEVLRHGAQTYGKNNWQKIENADGRLWNAALRHLIEAQNDKKKVDTETNLPHLAHCAVNLIFLLWYNFCNGEGENNDD